MTRLAALARWEPWRLGAALALALASAVALALVTGTIENPVVHRELATTTAQAAILVATSLLAGLVLATYLRTPPVRDGERAGATGSVLAFLAVGCPVCNKAVVLLVGTSGALDWFAPAQPVLGLAGIALMCGALWVRLGALGACRIPGTPRAGAPA